MQLFGTARFPQYVAALIATLGCFILGLALGWTSPVQIPLVYENQYGFSVSETQFSWIGSVMFVGALISAPAVGWMVSAVGRKVSMIILCIPSTLGFGLMAWAQNVYMFYIGRLLSGIGGGGFSIVVPLYLSEYAETEIRGTLGTYFQLQLTLGTLFTYVVGSIVSPFWLSVVCLLVPILYAMLMVLIPESPIFYLEKNKVKEAKQSLQWFRGDNKAVDSEFQMMQQNLQDELAEKLTFVEAFSTKAAKKGLVINLGLMLFQQFSGVNSVVFYTTTIFKAAGSTLSPNVQTIITGVVNCVITSISTVGVDRLGRRPLLLFSDGVMAISTFFIGLFFFLKDRDYNVDSFAWVPVTFVCVFLVSFAVGYGPIPWVYVSEVFPRQISGYAVSITCGSNFIFAFVVTNYFSNLSSLIGVGGAFFIYTFISLAGTFFVYFLVPETKNKTLEEIIKELGQ